MMQPRKGAPSTIKEINPHASALNLSTHWPDNPERLSDFLCLVGTAAVLFCGDFFGNTGREALSRRGFGDFRYEFDSRECSTLDRIDAVGQTNERLVRLGL